MKELTGKAVMLTIAIGESDQYHHHPLYSEIIARAHNAAIAGATVTRGIEGFGASNHIHTSRVLSLSSDLPVVISMIDTAEKINSFIPSVLELVSEGIVTTQEVEVILYGGRKNETA
ncbi:MAG: DUF190 domain-containing protein [Acidimicrobiales bacterium]|nr:DUF190 domain-containing protein [Acidimicrobiales bacterium]